MKPLLLVLIAVLSISFAKGQITYLGKSEKDVKDAMFKIKYTSFTSKLGADGILQENFDYSNGKSPEIKDTTKAPYIFQFKKDTCIMYSIFYSNFNNLPIVTNHLDLEYKKVSNNNWIDTQEENEAVIFRFQDGFRVMYKKASMP